MTKSLKIISSNRDIDGNWHKEDVEEEMRALDNPPQTETDWISWVFGHALSDVELDDPSILDTIAENEEIRQVKIEPANDVAFAISKI